MPRPTRVTPPVGVVRIRQVYSRAGRNYCAVSMPTAMMERLGWRPGELLQYYPTMDGAMKLAKVGNVMSNADPEYDKSSDEITLKPLRDVRPGSLAARAAQQDEKLEEIIAGLDEVDKIIVADMDYDQVVRHMERVKKIRRDQKDRKKAERAAKSKRSR